MLQRAARYAQAVPCKERRLRFGPMVVRVMVPASSAREADYFLDAFQSPEEQDSTDDMEFTLRVFDDALDGPTESFPWDPALMDVSGRVESSAVEPMAAWANATVGSVTVMDRSRGEGAVWVRSFVELPYWFTATPLRDELSWIADNHEMEFVHAAGIGQGDKGLCLVGGSGSGKSTSVLAALQGGWRTVGDDFLLIDRTRMYGVYRRAKMLQSSQQLLGDCSGHKIGGKVEEKWILDMASLASAEESFADELEPRAVCLLAVGDKARVEPVERSRVTQELLVHSAIGLRGCHPRSLLRMASFVRERPCVKLVMGPDVARNNRLLHKTLQAYG